MPEGGEELKKLDLFKEPVIIEIAKKHQKSEA
jgi:hypothetical protein